MIYKSANVDMREIWIIANSNPTTKKLNETAIWRTQSCTSDHRQLTISNSYATMTKS